MSTVIKGSGPLRTMDGMSFNFDDMAERANQYLDQVRAQGAQILDAAHRDAQQITKQAEQQGRDAALRAAEQLLDQKLKQQMHTLMPALNQAIADLEQAKQSWLTHWEKSAVQLACRIAERILKREQQKEPEIAIAMVREALELAAGSSEIQIQMNADDHAALATQVETLTREIARLADTQVVSHPDISPGGCRVLTRYGSIDNRFEAQLQRIERELT